MITIDRGASSVGTKRRVLIVHRYFWPDTPPYGWMLKSLAARLVMDGCEVTVLSTQPSYNPNAAIPLQPWRQKLDGYEIVRIPLFKENKRLWFVRALNAALFSARVFWHVLRKRYSIVMTATTPPIVLARAACWASGIRGARFIYHCQDIHPEVMHASGFVQAGLMFRSLRALDTRTCRRADAVVVLSDDMRKTIVERLGSDDAKIRTINNFDLEADSSAVQVPFALRKPPGRFRVLFAGNIGRFQGLELLIQAAMLLRAEPAVEFVFLGDGVAAESLKTSAGELLGRSVHFHSYQPPAVADAVVAQADLAVVSLNPGLFAYAYPSKVMTYLKAGTPLLALIEKDSELARMIEREGIGYVCGRTTPAEVADTVQRAWRAHIAAPLDRERIRRVWWQNFSRDRVLDRWSALYASV